MPRSIGREIANFSLSARISVGVLLLFAVATTLQLYLVGVSESTRALQDWQTALATRSDFKTAELQRDIGRLRGDALFLSHIPSVQGIARAGAHRGVDPVDKTTMATWTERLTGIFIAFANTHPEYYQIRLIGVADAGRELVRVESVKEGGAQVTPFTQLQQKGGRDYYLATEKLKAEEVYLSDLNLNREFGKVEIPHRPTLRAATPVYGPDGQLFGMVVINMSTTAMLDKLSGGLDASSRVYVTNQNGDYLVHSDASQTFGFDWGKTYRWQDDLSFQGSPPPEPVDAPPRLQEWVVSGEALHGVERQLHFDPQQPQRYITIRYAVPDALINQRIAAARNVTILSAVGVASLIALLLFLYVRRELAPLQQLGHAANDIGSGNYTPLLPAKASGEVGRLSDAFRMMLSRISTREQEVQQINEKLGASEAFSNLVLDTVPEGILVANANGIIVRTNTRITELFGHPDGSLLGQPVETLIPPRFHARHPGLRQGYADAPSARFMGKGGDLFGQHADGREFPVEIGLASLVLGGVQYVVASIVDISKRKQAEQQQIRFSMELKRINDELNNFAYAASHDLKSPLRGIDQLATWIEEDTQDVLSPEAQRHLRLMRVRIGRMEKLLDDLLAYSRAGRTNDEIAWVDTRELVLGVFDLADSSKPIQLVVADNMPVMHTRRVPLELVLRNLIGNAIKHHDKAQGTVAVTARPIAGGYEFAVHDDGPGIAAVHQQRVFAMFQTLKRRDEVEGSGIGLALVKKTVESQGGAVVLESDGKSGSTFRFTWSELGKPGVGL